MRTPLVMVEWIDSSGARFELRIIVCPQRQCKFHCCSEVENFSAVPERRVKKCWIQARSTAIARAMASIRNDEPGRFGVQGGHGRKTLGLSGLKGGDPAPV